MKNFIFIPFLFSYSIYAGVVNNYQVYGGKLHKGGSITMEIVENFVKTKTAHVKIHYQLNKRALVPVSADLLQGDNEKNIPNQIFEEAGVLELEQLQTMTLSGYTLKHMGRTHYKEFSDAHIIEIVQTGKSAVMTVTYHSSIPGTGWGEISLDIQEGIPVLNSYHLSAYLVD